MPGLLDSAIGGSYAFIDTDAKPSGSHEYRLVEIEFNGNQLIHGPYNRKVTGKKGKTAAGKKAKKKNFARVARKADAKNIRIWKQKKLERQADRKSARLASIQDAEALGSSAARIMTREEGMHYVSLSSMANPLGESARQLSKKLRQGNILITHKGIPIAYLPNNDFDGLYFYADLVNSNYTDENVYQVSVVRKNTDQVMRPAVVDGSVEVLPVSNQSFLSTVFIEEDNYLVTYAVKDPSDDVWFGGFISTGYYGNTDYTFDRDAPDAHESGQASIKLWLQGATDLVKGDDHHVEVRINDQLVGESTWDGATSNTVEFMFDQNLLKATANTVRINGVLDTVSLKVLSLLTVLNYLTSASTWLSRIH